MNYLKVNKHYYIINKFIIIYLFTALVLGEGQQYSNSCAVDWTMPNQLMLFHPLNRKTDIDYTEIGENLKV